MIHEVYIGQFEAKIMSCERTETLRRKTKYWRVRLSNGAIWDCFEHPLALKRLAEAIGLSADDLIEMMFSQTYTEAIQTLLDQKPTLSFQLSLKALDGEWFKRVELLALVHDRMDDQLIGTIT